jgi:hypothetical protein
VGAGKLINNEQLTMKVCIEMSKKEKSIGIIAIILLVIILFFYNRKYLYILDAEFDDDLASSIILKTGFIFPVKTLIPMDGEFKKKMKFYGYNISVKRVNNDFEIYLNDKKIQTVYTAPYYDKTHERPVGRVYLS